MTALMTTTTTTILIAGIDDFYSDIIRHTDIRLTTVFPLPIGTHIGGIGVAVPHGIGIIPVTIRTIIATIILGAIITVEIIGGGTMEATMPAVPNIVILIRI